MTENAYMPKVCEETTSEMSLNMWSCCFMCREVMTITATITTWPKTMAETAVSAAGWRKISQTGRAGPAGAASGWSSAI